MGIHYSLSVEASGKISSENCILQVVCPVHVTITVVEVEKNGMCVIIKRECDRMSYFMSEWLIVLPVMKVKSVGSS